MRAAWWWIDRWRQSSAYMDMTLAEQGAYRNLCDEVVLRDDGIIPDESLAKASGDALAWPPMAPKVLRWMRKVKGGWTNDTAREVKERGKGISELRAEAGARGGRAKAARAAAGNLTGYDSSKSSETDLANEQQKPGKTYSKGAGKDPSKTLPPDPYPYPSPLQDQDQEADNGRAGRLGVGGSGEEEPARLPATETSPGDRQATATPSERERLVAVRAEIMGLLRELVAVDPRRRDGQQLLAGASRTPGGQVIVNVEGCKRLPWLETTRDKLVGALLTVREAEGQGEPRTLPRTDQQERERQQLAAAMVGGLKGDGTWPLPAAGGGNGSDGRAVGEAVGRAGERGAAGLPAGPRHPSPARPALPAVAGRPGEAPLGRDGRNGDSAVQVVPDGGRAPGAVGGGRGGGRGAAGDGDGVGRADAAAPDGTDGGGDRGPEGGGAPRAGADQGGGGGAVEERASAGDTGVAEGRAGAGDESAVDLEASAMFKALRQHVGTSDRALIESLAPMRAVAVVDEGSYRTLRLQGPARSVLWLNEMASSLQDALSSAGFDDVELEMRPDPQGVAEPRRG